MSKTNKHKNKKQFSNGFYIFMSIVLTLIAIIIYGALSPTVDVEDKEPIENYVNAESKLEDFKGRPSVILFAGTYCGACNREVPKYKTEIWDKYYTKANLWLQVIDRKEFSADVLQGFNSNLNYEDITNSDCGFIPSFVVLNKDNEVVLQSCGMQKSISDIDEKLEELLE